MFQIETMYRIYVVCMSLNPFKHGAWRQRVLQARAREKACVAGFLRVFHASAIWCKSCVLF